MHQRILRDPELLPRGSRLMLAVSGGQDSMAMLGLLMELQRLHGWSLRIWHGDHSWHPNSSRFAKELQNWVLTTGLPWHCDQATPNTVSSEAAARQWRYEQLARHAHEQNCDVVTAHTASDRAETQLLQLARGTDLSGLGSLRSIRFLQEDDKQQAKLRRPLLGFTRSETAQICNELNLPIWNDPSNQDMRYARNRIRHRIMPILEQLYPDCSLRMANLGERISHIHDTQTELSRLALQHLSNGKGLNRSGWKQLGVTTRELLLHQWMQENGAPAMSAEQLNKLGHNLTHARPQTNLQLAAGWMIQIERETFCLTHSKEQKTK